MRRWRKKDGEIGDIRNFMTESESDQQREINTWTVEQRQTGTEI